ncbi:MULTISPECIES: FTR1 family iron permease [unclassified Candidatus Frackibacter]|uniref:FTR1 family iron permease n=1 Tax=unclassified Candidatus Frackibacter TaxID=2648818 RepID=UPI000889D15C|nr:MULTISPECIES: FTR1 family protein [unclassified Candidatus Frackibacter]SDC11792.1 high-affinity iron transporter [Candidatus Frackibacter sp. WG11]SEM36249.1 high-affinity iron transporter [Candidatus Frackibacter sp. WG12]SFL41498.1 high-affinity iron transporter [Candidatus Frackibacter sp. WG13]
MLSSKKKLLIVVLAMLILTAGFTLTSHAANSWHNVVNDIEVKINEGLSHYSNGDVKAAKESVTDAYFGPFEGEEMEQAVQRNVGSQNAFKVEYMFTQIKKLMGKGAPKQEVEQMATMLIKELKAYATQLDKVAPREETSPFSQFIYSFMIIVREGFEAILIIGAIIAYLIKSGNKDKVKAVYGSTGLAVVASIITAVLLQFVFKISGVGQEILEGVTMLLAMVVLFSVSFWLISKVEAKKWEEYIQGKVEDSLTTGNSFALWSAVFLAVYREGAETVLFYQALIADANKSSYGMIGLGFLVGCVALVAIYLIVRYGSVKLPLKPFFIGTSTLLYYLAFVFAGQGVRELQEAGVVGLGKIEVIPTISWLGIYPTWQTLSLQVVLVLAAVIGIGYQFLGDSGDAQVSA